MTRRRHRVLVVLAFALAGCATWQPPQGVDDAALRANALTQTARDVRVSAALLDDDTSEAMFGEDIRDAGVQPVWIEVENRTPQPLWLLRTGADPDYFSPLEVAWGLHKRFSDAHNASVDDRIASRAFANPILPGATNAGVVFLNPQTGTVLLNVDLFGNKTLVTFSMFLWRDVHGTRTSAPMSFRYPESETTVSPDLAALRKALERLPCCATKADGESQGDPLNVVLVGTAADIASATVRRNYRRDLRDDDAAQRLFGRAPDNVLRKRTQAGSPATWIRLWATPLRFEGKGVFVGQVGRPVGGRFVTMEARAPVLHADVDEARNLVVQDMMYSGGLERLGFVTGGAAETDGLRAVMFFAVRPRSLADVEFLDWEPYLERREAAARTEEPDASH